MFFALSAGGPIPPAPCMRWSWPARETVAVQHHRTHVASVLAERRAYEERVLDVAFEGAGYGDDGAIWGGELFVGSLEVPANDGGISLGRAASCFGGNKLGARRGVDSRESRPYHATPLMAPFGAGHCLRAGGQVP